MGRELRRSLSAFLAGLWMALLNCGFGNAEEIFHRSRELFQGGFAFERLSFHRFHDSARSLNQRAPIFGRSTANSAITWLRMAEEHLSSVFCELRIWLAAGPERTVGQNVLMANCDSVSRQPIGNHLTARSRRLVQRPLIVFVRLSGSRLLFENRRFITHVLEHP